MCCRYLFADPPKDARVKKIVALMDRDYPGQYKTGEIFPGDTAAAVIGEGGLLRHVPAVFGFPGFRESGRLLINARAETVEEKPTFRQAFRTQRAVLPADGFFEWSRTGEKTKYLFTLPQERTVYLCGLYTLVENRYRFVILTCPANDSMAETHDRMPVIAAAEEVRPYLTDFAAAKEILSRPGPQLNRQRAEE